MKLIVFLCLLGCSMMTSAAVIHLNNGDVISGDITSQGDDKITIAALFGEVTIDRQLIKKLEGVVAASAPSPSPAPSSKQVAVTQAPPEKPKRN